MASTDSEGLGTQPGFAVHTELELFVRSGLKPIDALRAATLTPARVLQVADSVGSIERGKIADLVLLDANPLTDINNTRRIAGVFRAGRWMSRQDGNAMLDSLARSYAPGHAPLTAFLDRLERGDGVGAMDVYRNSAPAAATHRRHRLRAHVRVRGVLNVQERGARLADGLVLRVSDTSSELPANIRISPT